MCKYVVPFTSSFSVEHGTGARRPVGDDGDEGLDDDEGFFSCRNLSMKSLVIVVGVSGLAVMMWMASGVCHGHSWLTGVPRDPGIRSGTTGGEVQRRVAVSVAGVQVLGEPRELGQCAQHVEVALFGSDVKCALLILTVTQCQDAGG
ncbi:hypothetical protein GQ600_21706 [Phytophthora cactorum]|nr:hypothetical protein GQ600_21706 [Phytophthora cactorum]